MLEARTSNSFSFAVFSERMLLIRGVVFQLNSGGLARLAVSLLEAIKKPFSTTRFIGFALDLASPNQTYS